MIDIQEYNNAYNKIVLTKEKYGRYRKCLFHLHTPVSHDYQLKSDWEAEDYKKASDSDVFEICKTDGLFEHLGDGIQMNRFVDLIDPIYIDRKEALSFLLIAYHLVKSEVSLVVLADHNTFGGKEKLEKALDNLKKLKCDIPEIYPYICNGIEISCADKMHVVGIFNDNYEKFFRWLKQSLVSVKDGTFETSYTVLEKIFEFGGFGYVAHINTSNILKNDDENHSYFLNNAYKQRLFNSRYMKIVGLNDAKHEKLMCDRMQKYRNAQKSVYFIIDNDAHYNEKINMNFTWLKCNKVSYETVIEALEDPGLSIRINEPQIDVTRNYIKGFYVQYEKPGFLSNSKSGGDFCIKLSESLNCLIGGRGTGKSTIIELLEYSLSQRCKSAEMLEFITNHGNMWLLYQYNEEEYIICVRNPFKNKNENILKYFGQNPENKFGYKYYFDYMSVAEFTLKQYIEIRKIEKRNNKIYYKNINDKRKTLNNFFDTRYSVNELVTTASGEKINAFIFELLFKNRSLSEMNSIINRKKALTSLINDMDKFLLERKNKVMEVVCGFNTSMRSVLQIVYTQNIKYNDVDIYKYLHISKEKNKLYNNYNITCENVVEYIQHVCDKEGFTSFFKYILNCLNDNCEIKYSIIDFLEPYDSYLVKSKGKCRYIDYENEHQFIKGLYSKIINDNNMSLIKRDFIKYIENSEFFSLEFNIYNKEGNTKKLFKDVRLLSLGQKVVAMLDFIIGYSDYSKDYRPLIIDQPEDNLDNSYIYKNLVSQLRENKEKRQVIIATHNATIVTNSMSDLVCVMDSDNKHGWIKMVGYPSEIKIKKEIINCLEGGIDSFKHKMEIYNLIYKNNEKYNTR